MSSPSAPRTSPSETPLSSRSLEEINFERLEAFLGRLQGRRVPGLYRLIMGQVERALLRAALAQTHDHLGEAARLLGLDRNTLSRKARSLGLPLVSRPGRKRKSR
jgi:DNA-binding protein Fis